ncbi:MULTISPECIES: hypothetical protein [Rufibacter]|uniref:FEKKY domain-containing protein n=1 Tax=Rufibacter TaxID=1379908 RepID=UPI001B305F37|nr:MULTISPECIES: hypothetical protein [Rufibacter]
MKNLLLVLLILSSAMAYGQTVKITDEQYNQSGAIKIVFVQSIEEAKELAEEDIRKGLPFLLLQSGISPVVYPTDSEFEETFKAYYYESGCTGPRLEYARAYNQRIFSYLTETHGTKWKRKIRKDVIGFKK